MLQQAVELCVRPGVIRDSKCPNGSQATMHSDVVFPHVIETGTTVPVGDAGTAYIPSCFHVTGGSRRVVKLKPGLCPPPVSCSSTRMKSVCTEGSSRSGLMHAISSNSVIRTEWDEACREFGELGSEHEERERFLDPSVCHTALTAWVVWGKVGLQDVWCAAKSAPRTCGVEDAGL